MKKWIPQIALSIADITITVSVLPSNAPVWKIILLIAAIKFTAFLYCSLENKFNK